MWGAFGLYDYCFVFVLSFKYLPKCECQHNSHKNPDFCLHLKTWRLWQYWVHILQGRREPLTYNLPHFLLFMPRGAVWPSLPGSASQSEAWGKTLCVSFA